MDLEPKNLNSLTGIDYLWVKAAINHHEWTEVALRNERAKRLYDAYHSDRYADKGNVGDTLTIPLDYREEWVRLLEKYRNNC